MDRPRCRLLKDSQRLPRYGAEFVLKEKIHRTMSRRENHIFKHQEEHLDGGESTGGLTAG